MNKSNELQNGLVYENINTLPSFFWMRKGHRSVKIKKTIFTYDRKAEVDDWKLEIYEYFIFPI